MVFDHSAISSTATIFRSLLGWKTTSFVDSTIMSVQDVNDRLLLIAPNWRREEERAPQGVGTDGNHKPTTTHRGGPIISRFQEFGIDDITYLLEGLDDALGDGLELFVGPQGRRVLENGQARLLGFDEQQRFAEKRSYLPFPFESKLLATGAKVLARRRPGVEVNLWCACVVPVEDVVIEFFGGDVNTLSMFSQVGRSRS